MRKATMTKTKRAKFGKGLSAGESVFVKESKGKDGVRYMAARKEDDVLWYGITDKQFKYID